MKKLLPYVLTAFLTLGTLGVYGQKNYSFIPKKHQKKADKIGMDVQAYFLTQDLDFQGLNPEDSLRLQDLYFVNVQGDMNVIVRIPGTDYFAHGIGNTFSAASFSAKQLKNKLIGVHIETLASMDGLSGMFYKGSRDQIITAEECRMYEANKEQD